MYQLTALEEKYEIPNPKEQQQQQKKKQNSSIFLNAVACITNNYDQIKLFNLRDY